MTRRSPYIIGYSFNSAVCCPRCTAHAFEDGELIRLLNDGDGKPLPRTETTFNLPGTHPFTIPESLFNIDHEPVRPIFNTDDYPDGYTCDDCGETIP